MQLQNEKEKNRKAAPPPWHMPLSGPDANGFGQCGEMAALFALPKVQLQQKCSYKRHQKQIGQLKIVMATARKTAERIQLIVEAVEKYKL